MYVFYDILKQKKEHKNGFKYYDQQLNFCLSKPYYPNTLGNYASVTSIIADLYTDNTYKKRFSHTKYAGNAFLRCHTM